MSPALGARPRPVKHVSLLHVHASKGEIQVRKLRRFGSRSPDTQTYIKQTTAMHPEMRMMHDEAIETMVAVSMSTPVPRKGAH